MKPFKTTLVMAVFAVTVLLNVNLAISQTNGWHKAGSQPNDYEMKIVTDVMHGGNGSVIIRALKNSVHGFGTYMQTFKADVYHGKRIRLTGWIKSQDAYSAQMWVRLDGQEQMTGFDNMDNRPIKGTQDWQECSIVLDVSEETVFIAFGAFVSGSGTAWVDDYAFEVVDNDIPTTNMLTDEPQVSTEEQKEYHKNYIKTNYPSEPENLGCDQL